MKEKIMIIGGSGHVGKIIARELAQKYPNKVVIAGRNAQKLNAFIQAERLPIESFVFDISQPFKAADFAEVRLAIVCLDQVGTEFVEFCQREKIAYLDVSANAAFYQQLTTLGELKAAPVVYSVGLAPGLTNLAAEKVIAELGEFDELALKIGLGLGDSHGEAATAWTLDHLGQTYQLANRGEPLVTFKEKNRLNLAQGKGLPVYNFNFSDQHSLIQRWPDKKIMTYLGFDLPFATNGLAFSRKLGLLNLVKRPKIKRVVSGLMAKGLIGSAQYWVQVTAINYKTKQVAEVTVTGFDEALATGKIAAYIANQVYLDDSQSGLLSATDFSQYAEIVAAIPELTEL